MHASNQENIMFKVLAWTMQLIKKNNFQLSDLSFS